MPREPSLPRVVFGWHYFARNAASNGRIVANESERSVFCRLLRMTLVGHGVHLHFLHAASHFVEDGCCRLNQLGGAFHCRSRTLSTGRRRAYQLKFEERFNRPCQALVVDADSYDFREGERVEKRGRNGK
jgi:hypothetical protein